jgi:RNA polymerase sporulation-specific sigma factor
MASKKQYKNQKRIVRARRKAKKQPKKAPQKKVPQPPPPKRPPRLYDNKQILELVERVKKDNDEEAFKEISKMLHGFLQHLSLKKFFFVAGNNHEDIYQEGLLALSSKAIPDYDRDKGPFLSFAKLCIKRHIITCLKSANNNKNRALNSSVSMDATVTGEDDDGPMSISSFLSSEDEVVIERICRLEQNKALRYELEDKLTPLELRVLSFYLKSMS